MVKGKGGGISFLLVANIRRPLMELVGLTVFICIDLLIILVWEAPPAYSSKGEAGAHLISSLIWEMLGHWLPPFLLWIITVNRQLGVLIFPRQRRSEAV